MARALPPLPRSLEVVEGASRVAQSHPWLQWELKKHREEAETPSVEAEHLGPLRQKLAGYRETTARVGGAELR